MGVLVALAIILVNALMPVRLKGLYPLLLYHHRLTLMTQHLLVCNVATALGYGNDRHVADKRICLSQKLSENLET